jgi:hypothetical protein
VFDGTPLEHSEPFDCVSLGAVLGWILEIGGFECPSATSHTTAVRNAWARKGESPHQTEALQLMRALISAKVSTAELLVSRARRTSVGKENDSVIAVPCAKEGGKRVVFGTSR